MIGVHAIIGVYCVVVESIMVEYLYIHFGLMSRVCICRFKDECSYIYIYILYHWH